MLFAPRQKVKAEALAEGTGYYSDPYYTPCVSEDGKCAKGGKRKTIRYCIPHPITGKGCIDPDGYQTFTTLIQEEDCEVQCRKSVFEVSEEFGCDNLVSTKGMDVSSFYKNGVNRIYGPINFQDIENFNYLLFPSFLPNDPYLPVVQTYDSSVYPYGLTYKEGAYLIASSPDFGFSTANVIFREASGDPDITPILKIKVEDTALTSDQIYYRFTSDGNKFKVGRAAVDGIPGYELVLPDPDFNNLIDLQLDFDNSLFSLDPDTNEVYTVYINKEGVLWILTLDEYKNLGKKLKDDYQKLKILLPYTKDLNTDNDKPCIPSDVQSYRQKYYKCVSHDNTGENACIYTCGLDAPIKLNNSGFNGELTEIPSYYPINPDFMEISVRYCLNSEGEDLLLPLTQKSRKLKKCDDNGEMFCTEAEDKSFTYNNKTFKYKVQYDIRNCRSGVCNDFDTGKDVKVSLGEDGDLEISTDSDDSSNKNKSTIYVKKLKDNETIVINRNQEPVTLKNFIFPKLCYSEISAAFNNDQEKMNILLDLRPFNTPLIRGKDNVYRNGCIDTKGNQLAKGTQIQILEGETLIVNIGCSIPDSEICGKWKTYIDPTEKKKGVEKCKQNRGALDFSKECKVLKTIGSGLNLPKMFARGYITRQAYCLNDDTKIIDGKIYDSTQTYKTGDIVFSSVNGNRGPYQYRALQNVPKAVNTSDEDFWVRIKSCPYERSSFFSESEYYYTDLTNPPEDLKMSAMEKKDALYTKDKAIECIEDCIYFQDSEEQRQADIAAFISYYENENFSSVAEYQKLFDKVLYLKKDNKILCLTHTPCSKDAEEYGGFLSNCGSDYTDELYGQTVTLLDINAFSSSLCQSNSVNVPELTSAEFSNALMLYIIPEEMVSIASAEYLKCKIIAIFGMNYYGYLSFNDGLKKYVNKEEERVLYFSFSEFRSGIKSEIIDQQVKLSPVNESSDLYIQYVNDEVHIFGMVNNVITELYIADGLNMNSGIVSPYILKEALEIQNFSPEALKDKDKCEKYAALIMERQSQRNPDTCNIFYPYDPTLPEIDICASFLAGELIS